MKIKPCPFCGNAKPYFYQRWRVECDRCGCGLYGPEAKNEDEAVAWWNAVPRLRGSKLGERRKQFRLRMNATLRREGRERKILAKERAREEAPRRRQERADKKWAADRARWLASPINENSRPSIAGACGYDL